MAEKKEAPGTELAVFDPQQSAYPVLFDQGEGGIAEILADNFGEDGFQAGDLDRIKIPAAGGRFWDVPDEQPVAVLEGVLVHKQKTRSYWIKDVDEQGDEGGQPPDCASANGILGNGVFGPGSPGNPSGECGDCPMNTYGSGKGNGKACKEQMQLFMLREGSILPMQVTLPPTSLKPFRKYMTRLASKAVPFYGVVTRLGLTQERGPAGPYSVAVPERGGDIDPAERAAAKAYGETIAGSFVASLEARTAATDRVIDAEGRPVNGGYDGATGEATGEPQDD